MKCERVAVCSQRLEAELPTGCQSLSDLGCRQGFQLIFIHNAELAIKSSSCGLTIRWFTNTRLSIKMLSGKLSTLAAGVSFIIHVIDPSMDRLSARCLSVPCQSTLLCTWSRWSPFPSGQMSFISLYFVDRSRLQRLTDFVAAKPAGEKVSSERGEPSIEFKKCLWILKEESSLTSGLLSIYGKNWRPQCKSLNARF